MANDAGDAYVRIETGECNIDDIEPSEPPQDKAPEPTTAPPLTEESTEV